eukprot:2964053-Pyramimonas_sp.AAC.1
MRDEDARSLEAHFEALRAGRLQRKWPRMDRGGKDARVPLGRLPILAMRSDRTDRSGVSPCSQIALKNCQRQQKRRL